MSPQVVLEAMAGLDVSAFAYLSLATLFASMTLTMKDGPAGLAARWRRLWLRHAGYRPFSREAAAPVADIVAELPAALHEREWYRPRLIENESGVEMLLLEDRWQDWRTTFVSCVYCAAPWVFGLLLLVWTFGGPIGVLMVKVLAGAGAASALFSLGRYA